MDTPRSLTELNSVALVRKRTIPTKRPPLVDEVSAWSVQRIPTVVNLGFLDPEPLLFHSSSPSVFLTRLSGPVPDPILFRKSGSARNQTPTSGSAARNSTLHKVTNNVTGKTNTITIF
jgi:hypothetical protein